MTPTTGVPALGDAITAVEQAQTGYQNAATQTSNDQTAAAAIQTKLDAANAQVVTDQTNQATAATTFNAAIDNLIAAATAAKIPVPATGQ
jgi:hypothetical protein